MEADKQHLFDYLNLFAPIPVSDFMLMADEFQSKNVKKGEKIIAAGDVQHHLLFVRAGIQMSYALHAGRQHIIAFTYPPNPCAIPESFTLQQPSPYFLESITDSSFYTLRFDRLQNILSASHPLEHLFRKMTEIMLIGMINRHLELHTCDIETRFKRFAERSGWLFNMIPHKYLAAYLGMDPTNFSRLYNRIKI